MIPTVEQVYDLTAYLLGDPMKKVFTPSYLMQAFGSAWQEMMDYALADQIPFIESAASYTLPANTASLTPATAGITNFGELVRMEERPAGSSEEYTGVVPVTQLSQRPADSALREFKWRADAWFFVGATQNIDLRITYYLSGKAPSTGSTGFDNCLNFLAYRTAAIAGPPLGFDLGLARSYDVEARGPGLDGSAGHIFKLLQPMVRSKQKMPLQLPAYDEYAGEPLSRYSRSRPY